MHVVEQISNVQALMHLLKAYVGTGILAMPKAFSYSGIVLGAIGTPIIGVLCNSCIHMLIDINKHLGNKLKCEPLEYEDIVEQTMLNGPKPFVKWARFCKCLMITFLVLTQMGFCCSYCLFIAENMRQFLIFMGQHFNSLPNASMSVQWYLLILWPILILINFNKSIRALTIASACANVVQLASFGIIVYNLVQNIKPLKSNEVLIGNEFPLFFSTAVYTFEGITVTMPLYRAVRNKYNFSKATGVVNVALIIVVILYLGIGLLGYLKYGADVGDVLTLSLPNEPLYNSVLVMYSCVICVSYPVQMYVTLQLLCPRVEYYLHELNMNTCLVTFCDYLLRAVMVTITFAFAAFIPNLSLIISLVGAVSCSGVGIIFPPMLHTISFWERDIDRRAKAMIYIRNLIVFIIGVLGFATGTYFSIKDIVDMYD